MEEDDDAELVAGAKPVDGVGGGLRRGRRRRARQRRNRSLRRGPARRQEQRRELEAGAGPAQVGAAAGGRQGAHRYQAPWRDSTALTVSSEIFRSSNRLLVRTYSTSHRIICWKLLLLRPLT